MFVVCCYKSPPDDLWGFAWRRSVKFIMAFMAVFILQCNCVLLQELVKCDHMIKEQVEHRISCSFYCRVLIWYLIFLIWYENFTNVIEKIFAHQILAKVYSLKEKTRVWCRILSTPNCHAQTNKHIGSWEVQFILVYMNAYNWEK